MLKGFKEFVMRGNVVDLAVAVIVGTAFGAVVKSFADDFIGGLIAAVGGVPDFSREGIELNGTNVIYGTTITAVINFLIVGAVVYFVVVVPVRRLTERDAKTDADTPAPSDEAVLLTEIRDLLQAGQRP